MSIYQPRSKRPIKDKDVTEPARGAGTPPPSGPAPASQNPAQDWSRLRKAMPANYALPMSLEWIRSLPENRRPLALASQYPRIVNVLALLWGDPAACKKHFDDLLVDHRGKRKGFPADVHRDLRLLRDYYHSLHPTGLQLAPDE